jgi:hypothetical protein
MVGNCAVDTTYNKILVTNKMAKSKVCTKIGELLECGGCHLGWLGWVLLLLILIAGFIAWRMMSGLGRLSKSVEDAFESTEWTIEDENEPPLST